jgi:hypothetical protein
MEILMSITKIRDIESIKLSAPDLSVMREFLIDFGLLDLGPQNDGVLRMRSWGLAPCVHETELGAPDFRSVTFRAQSLADLEALAAHDGVPVEDCMKPGGGKLIKLTDPDGFVVEVIAGGTPAQELPSPTLEQWNVCNKAERKNVAKRITPGPSKALRLGHAVFFVSDLQRTWKWWHERFGLLISDEVRTPDGNTISIFVRCDRGDEATDHHTFNFAAMPGEAPKFHHAAFEVKDLDDLMVGHDYLLSRGHNHAWGIGRHYLGSQVFDYWLDPCGNRFEHWTDGDLFAAHSPTNIADVETMLGRQWGPKAPADFV